MARADLLAGLGLVFLWLIPILVVGTAGEFPLADDWAYARTTRTFVETGRFERDAWVWIPLFSHVAIGSAFVRLFGFSFETLRWSGLALGLLGALGTYALSRALGTKRVLAGLVAGGVATSPLWVNLSFSFMTDVPFAALCALALALMVRAVQSDDRVALLPLVLGSAVALAAAASRQIGLALLAAAALALLVRHLRDPRAWAFAAASLAAATGLFALAPRLFSAGDAQQLFALRDLQARFESPHALYHLVRNSLAALVYLGVFLSPAVLLSLPADRRLARRAGAACAALACLLVLGLAVSGFWLPPGIDVIHDFYFGPIALHGSETLPQAPAAFWWAFAGVGLTSGLFVIARLGLGLWEERRSRHATARLVPLLFAVLYLGPLLVVWPFFDRYLVPLLAPLAALLVSLPGRQARAPAAAALILLAAFGVVGTRDVMEHHRARWALLDDLTAQGIDSERIDGGTQFGGWHHYRPQRRAFRQRIGRYFVVDDEYVVSLGEAPAGYEETAHLEYRRLLPPRSERVTVYRRADPARAE